MVGGLSRAETFEPMSMSMNAAFVGLAPLATMSSTTASTLSSADKGEGVWTGENEGEFMAMTNIVSSPVLLIDYALVRTESSPHLWRCLPLSSKGRFRSIPVEGIMPYLALFKFCQSLRNAKAEAILEGRSTIEVDVFLLPTLAFILRRTFVEDRGVESWKIVPHILV